MCGACLADRDALTNRPGRRPSARDPCTRVIERDVANPDGKLQRRAHRRAVAPLCSSPPHCALCGRLLPTLFVIGSLKTGTTSLWSHLVDHTEGVVLSGGLTHKGAVSRKEKDFFGDPDQWKLGRRWYERIYPPCPAKSSSRAAAVAIDATPAYHVFHAAPANMASFFGPANAARLRLVWMLREPVGKFWSYFGS